MSPSVRTMAMTRVDDDAEHRRASSRRMRSANDPGTVGATCMTHPREYQPWPARNRNYPTLSFMPEGPEIETEHLRETIHEPPSGSLLRNIALSTALFAA